MWLMLGSLCFVLLVTRVNTKNYIFYTLTLSVSLSPAYVHARTTCLYLYTMSCTLFMWYTL